MLCIRIFSSDDFILFPVLHDHAEKKSSLFATDSRPSGRTVYLPVPFRLIHPSISRWLFSRPSADSYSPGVPTMPAHLLKKFAFSYVSLNLPLFLSQAPPLPLFMMNHTNIRSFHPSALPNGSTPPMPNIHIPPPCRVEPNIMRPSAGCSLWVRWMIGGGRRGEGRKYLPLDV